MRIFSLFILLWSVFLGRYFLLNEWGMDFAIFISARLGLVLQFTALVLSCLCLGLRILKWIYPSIVQSFKIIFGMGLGLGVLSLYVFFCGILGFLNIQIVAIFLAVAFCLGFKEGLDLMRRLLHFFSHGLKALDPIILLLSLPLILSVVGYAMGALTPIIDYDALEYHVGLPAHYIKIGRISAMPNHVYSHFPMNTEMLYLISILLGRPEFIKFFNFLFVMLTGGLVYQSIHRIWGGIWGIRGGLIGAIVFLCSGHLVIVSWMGKSDSAHAFFCLASFLPLVLERNRASVVLSGIFAGLALGSKSLAFFYVYGALIMAWILIDRKGIKTLQNMGLYLGVSVLFASPWWAKNFFETGDPLFPMGSYWVKSSIWSAAQYSQWWAYHTRSLKDVLSSLFSMSNSLREGGVFFPTVYVGLPMALFCWREWRVRFLVLYALLGYVFFLLGTVGDPRFLLPIFPVLAIVVGGSFASLRNYPWVKKITAFTMALFIFWNLGSIAISLEAFKAPSLFWGVQSPEQYLREKLPPYPSIEFLNQIMQRKEKVLFLGEARTFYLEGEVIAPTVFDHPGIVPYFKNAKDDSEVYKRFRKDDIHYLLINSMEIYRWHQNIPGWDQDIDWGRLKKFIHHFGKLVYHEPKTGIQIYRLDT